MKFFAFALLALAAVASAKKFDLVLDGQTSSYTNQLARQIAPLLLNRQLASYNTVPVSVNAVRAAPQIYSTPYRAAAYQTAAYQTVAAAPSVQYVQAAAPAVQYVQAAPVAQYVQAAYQHTGPIAAAVQSQRSVQVIDAPSTGAVAPTQTVVIGPSIQPLDLEFQSQSSPVSTRQIHIPGTPNPPQFSSHQDEPDLLKQEIVKPIVHEVTEAIQPFRKITQEVRPVQETINQLLTRGQQVQTVQAAAVQTVAVQAQPSVQVVQAQPALQLEAVAAPQISVASAPVSVEVVEEPVISTVAQPTISVEHAPVSTVETVAVEAAPALTYAAGTNFQTIPVTAAITRY